MIIALSQTKLIRKLERSFFKPSWEERFNQDDLTEHDKLLFKSNEYEKSGSLGKVNLSKRSRETFSKSLGPTGSNDCPCCGK